MFFGLFAIKTDDERLDRNAITQENFLIEKINGKILKSNLDNP